MVGSRFSTWHQASCGMEAVTVVSALGQIWLLGPAPILTNSPSSCVGEFCISLGPGAISLFLSWASKKTQVRDHQVAVCSLIWPAFSVFGFRLQSDLKNWGISPRNQDFWLPLGIWECWQNRPTINT